MGLINSQDDSPTSPLQNVRATDEMLTKDPVAKPSQVEAEFYDKQPKASQQRQQVFRSGISSEQFSRSPFLRSHYHATEAVDEFCPKIIITPQFLITYICSRFQISCPRKLDIAQLLIDGTFKTPTKYKQMLIICGYDEKKNFSFNLCHIG
jgi:hypothetical protein